MIDTKNVLFSIAITLLLLFGCIGGQTETPPQTKIKETVVLGDTVLVDYTLKLDDGTVIDTSIKSVAEQAGIYDSNREYKPLGFKVGEGTGLLKGFVYGTIGMKANETKEVILQPADGYGVYDPEKTYDLDLYYNISKYVNVSRKTLEAKGWDIFKGNVYDTDVSTVAIEAFDNETVTLRYQLQVGQKFTFNGVPQKVVNITNNDTFIIKLDLVKGMEYQVGGQTGNRVAKVTEINDTVAILDENGPLAGKVLHFFVTVKGIY